MRWNRLSAVARKESIHVMRDPRSLVLAFCIPMMLLVLFGFALTLDVDRVPVVVWDQSGTAQSRELVSHFEGSRYFSVVGRVSSYGELERAIDVGRAILGLVVPGEFARDLTANRTAEVQVLADGSDSNTAGISMGYAEAAVQAYSGQVLARALRRGAARPPRPAIDARTRVWYNPDLQSGRLIIPGQMAIIMVILSSLLTSLTFAREWESGTMEQLISTPVRGSELVLGKLAPYVAIGMADILLAMAATRFVFHMEMAGSPALFLPLAFVFLVGSLAMGMLISIVFKVQLMASQLSMMLTYLPAIMLSGLVFAIQNMPAPIRLLTYLFPARYFITIIKGVYIKGLGVESMLIEVSLMCAFSSGMVALCVLKFRKDLE